MKNRIPLLAFAIFLMAPLAAHATSTKDFVQKASIGNRFEITSSQVALQDAGRDDVKQFAQQMVDDHTKTANQLEEIISSSTDIPPAAAALDSKHENMMSDLENTHKDFDKKYVKMQLKAHDDAIALFKDYAKHGDNETLKKFASDTLPLLEEHRQHIKEIKSSF